MGKNVQHVQHVKSNVVENGSPKLPTPSVLAEGEIAINFAEGYETLSIKSSSGNIKTFSSDEYYTEQKLGSGFTGANSGKSVTDAIVDNELVWTNAYVTLSGAVSAHTENTDIHLTQTEKTNIDSLAANIAAISGITSTNVTNWNNASTDRHTHSNKSALDNITGNVGTMAYENKTSYSSATEVNTALGNKLEASDVADFFDNAKYELSGTTHVINFYNGSTVKATIDADDFIKDGMISAVTLDTKSGTTYLVIEWNTDAGIQTTELNIGDLFEADNYYTKSQTSGATELSTAFGNKADTAITLAGYGITDAYTKSETSGATQISDALGAKVNTSDIVSAITPSNSGSTAPIATNIVAENELIVSNALTDLDERKLDASAYTPTDLSNYYTKDETSGKTEISNALGAKVNTATFTGHTTDTSVHFTTGAVQTQINNSISGKVNTSDVVTAITSSNSGSTSPVSVMAVVDAINDTEEVWAITINDLNTNKFGGVNYDSNTKRINFYASGTTGTILAYVDATDFIKDGMVSNAEVKTVAGSGTCLVISFNTDSGKEDINIPISNIFDASNYYTTAQTSGATELSTAFGLKVNTADVVTAITSGTSASTNPVATKAVMDVIASNERVTSSSLNDLNTKINSHSADTTIHFTTGTVQTQITNSISGKADTTAVTQVNNALTAHTANTTVHVTSTDKTTWNAVTAKTDNSAFTAHTASTVHMTTTEKTNLDSLATNIGAISGVSSTKVSNWDTAYTNNHTHSNKTYLDGITGTVGTMAYQNTSSYSSATQVNTALAGKSDTGHTHVSSGVTAMTGYAKAANGSSIATGDTLNQAIGKLEASVDDLNSQSETIAAALVDLNTNKADKSDLGGLKLVKVTQAQYDALATKDSNTLYVISD